MSSELWQRIRAARKYKNLRQQDIAEACGVSRGAVAQWEYEDPLKRTTPSIDQMKATAKATGVPLEWLLSDSSNLGDIWQYAVINKPAEITPRSMPPLPDSLLENAIRYEVRELRPDLDSGFSRSIGNAPFAAQPDFMWDGVVVEIKSQLTESVPATLLMSERISGRKLQKVLLLVDRNDSTPEAHKKALSQTFGIHVISVPSVQDAARELIALSH